jgi:SAM-dependent methyltransferase
MFVLADARRFILAPQFDAVLSSFNSLAHASSVSELTAILHNAHAALKPEGKLLFDLSMEEAYTSKWRGAFGETHPDLAWMLRPSYDRTIHRARNDVTAFHRLGELWYRHEFTITQCCFSEEEICAAISAARFRNFVSYDAERDLGMTGEFGRRFFACS